MQLQSDVLDQLPMLHDRLHSSRYGISFALSGMCNASQLPPDKPGLTIMTTVVQLQHMTGL